MLKVLETAGALIVLAGFMWGAARLASSQAVGPVQRSLNELSARVHEAGLQTAKLTGFANHLTRVLATTKIITVDQVVELAQSYNPQWDRLDQEEAASHNPLSPEELDRFEGYRVKLAERGQMLAPDEVADFQALSEKLYRDRPNDPTIPLLLGLGLLLAAVAVAASRPVPHSGSRGGPDPLANPLTPAP